MDYIMETVGLRKAYKDNIVVDDVNMHISKGAIYGFVGPNGAGKSTVMKMILSLIQPDAGEVQLLGEKVTSHSYEIFKKVGSIIENPYFYDKMTARQNLELHCEYMGFPNKERIDEVLHLVDLQNVEKKQVCHYSLGMKQRLAIARAILAKPEFLILDEPINALDPEGIREMRTLFQRLNQEDGTTIFISSHILSEVDLLADTIGIIQHGKLLTELPIEEIHKHQTDYISLQVDDVTRVAALLENMRITNFSVLDKEFIHIYDSDISGKALSKAIIENGIGLESMGRKQDTLEDFFSGLQRRKNEMTHLIKLELKKFGIAQNIIFMFAAILFSILFITISLWDSMTDPKQVKDTFESTYLVIGLLMSFIFLVYSSVLTAKLVIGEYNHRTITIMFSYPLNRIKLIASKLTIIMVYTAISMTIGYICCSSYIIFADKSFNMLEGTFQPSMLRTWIPMAITTVIICMVLSLWSFIIGMIRKSVPATIVTSLIVIVLRQVIITKNTTNQESIMQVILVAIVTVIATLLIFKRKVPELY